MTATTVTPMSSSRPERGELVRDVAFVFVLDPTDAQAAELAR
jgi:hypothetical protein